MVEDMYNTIKDVPQNVSSKRHTKITSVGKKEKGDIAKLAEVT